MAIASNDPPTARPPQGVFTEGERDWINSNWVPEFRAYAKTLPKQGTRGIKGSKGKKKAWVMEKVYPAYVKQHNSEGPGGPSLESLKYVRIHYHGHRVYMDSDYHATQKLYKYMVNQLDSNDSTTIPMRDTSKKPRATNGIAIFADEHADTIRQAMRNESVKKPVNTPDGSMSAGKMAAAPLRSYHHAKKTLYDKLDDDKKAEYEAIAAEQNDMLKRMPDPSVVFK